MGKYKRYKYNKIDHLAGIVPIGGKPLDFNMPWHDCLLPVAPDYLAVEQAVFQCASAGCETIWIVGHKGSTPLIRKRLGDYVLDPVGDDAGIYRSDKKTVIPIFYVPILPKDYNKRDSLGWSVLHGADCAFRVSCFISKWTIPTRFFCSFPYGIAPPEFIRSLRNNYINQETQTIFSHEGKTIKDGLHIPFTFDATDYKNCRDIVKRKNLEDWDQRKEKDAREFTLQEIFEPLDLLNNSVVELPWFYDVSSWKNYCNYTASSHSQEIKKINHLFTREKRRLFPTKQEELNRNAEGKLEEKV